jgi:hypothetical protein
MQSAPWLRRYDSGGKINVSAHKGWGRRFPLAALSDSPLRGGLGGCKKCPNTPLTPLEGGNNRINILRREIDGPNPYAR